MKYLSILGSTGSIGVNTINVVRANPHRYEITALAAGGNAELLAEQIKEFHPRLVAVKDETTARALEQKLSSDRIPEIIWGNEGYKEVATAKGVEMVVSAMAGAAGLLPTLQAIRAGKDIALATKEVMVMAGDLVTALAKTSGSKILPVDSEHCAIFQCLVGHRRQDVTRVILTASGGPFLHLPLEELPNVTPSQALNHPKWRMGKKISIDSATMMNKGLEVLEARCLFDLELEQIDIHIHPQSIVHSLVEYLDGSVLAQLGMPDMKAPIAYALSYPERMDAMISRLDLLALHKLEFLPAEQERFPGLALAYAAGRAGGIMPAVLNAANEEAVSAFIDGRIGFHQITDVVQNTMASVPETETIPTIEDILEADRYAREIASEYMNNIEIVH